MLFNSLQFLIFFPAVVILYWILPGRWRNAMLLIASYYFYMNWQPAFGLLLAGASVITWGGALLIARFSTDGEEDEDKVLRKGRRHILVSTILLLLATLFTFKYLNFFNREIHFLFAKAGIAMAVPQFEILLPVGISFFTFQAIGYLVDVSRSTVKVERDLLTVMLFLAFFPQLVAGPIERARDMIPQFHRVHRFSFPELMSGIEMMLLGYFMKLCVAENVGIYVDKVYGNLSGHSGIDILVATTFFCFQILADFGGYSLIAIGAARCMGFRLTQNFRQPYLATSVRDFWRRWHISLSSWLQDYVYIPLGGNRVKHLRHYFNIFSTLFISGVWHGADYTFFAWGAYHGTLQTAQAVWNKKSRFHLPANFFNTCLKIFWTFVLIMLGRVFFRADSISDSMLAFRKIFTEPGTFDPNGYTFFFEKVLLILILIVIELRHEYKDRHIRQDTIFRSAVKIAILLALIILFGQFSSAPFIYFQF